MPFAEDFSVFFADFGVPATLESGASITVIFDRAHIEAMGGDISGTRPIAVAQSTDAAGLVPNVTRLSIGGISYTLLDTEPDGTGMSTLLLEAA